MATVYRIRNRPSQEWCEDCRSSYAYQWESDDEYHDTEEDDQTIAGYHSTSFVVVDSPWCKAQLLRTVSTRRYSSPQPLRFGVELEVECPTEDKRRSLAKQVRASVNARHLAGIESDGSLHCGFEIITQPMGLDVQREFWSAINLAKLRSHDTSTCGLHVHMTRAAMSKLTICKLVEFVGSAANKAFLEGFCRRSFSRYAMQCRKEQLSYALECDDRYEAINVTNDDTIEFRLPRGSCRKPTILATIEFANAMVRFCEVTSTRNLTADAFVEFLASHRMRTDTRDLRRYLADRNLVAGRRLGLPKPRLEFVASVPPIDVMPPRIDVATSIHAFT